MPDTIQTSPFHVDTAARPSRKKSNAPVRMREPKRFSNGIVIVSTANGPSPVPSEPCVTIGSPHCAARGAVGNAATGSFLVNAGSTASRWASSPAVIASCRRSGCSCGGTRNRMRPPWTSSVAGCSPRNAQASIRTGRPSTSTGACRSPANTSTSLKNAPPLRTANSRCRKRPSVLPLPIEAACLSPWPSSPVSTLAIFCQPARSGSLASASGAAFALLPNTSYCCTLR